MNTYKNKALTFLNVLLISLMLTTSVQAQNTSETQDKSSEAEKTNSSKAESTQKGEKRQVERKKKKPDVVFRPTEEISEDAPVPFPVDI